MTIPAPSARGEGTITEIRGSLVSLTQFRGRVLFLRLVVMSAQRNQQPEDRGMNPWATIVQHRDQKFINVAEFLLEE